MRKNWKRVLSSIMAVGVLSAVMMSFSASSARTISRNYTKYNYLTGQLSEYTLTVEEETGTSSRAVIGTDDRFYSTYEENTGIVRTLSSFKDEEGKTHLGTGTGFIIGDHTIATAAHCVVGNDGVGGFPKSIKIEFYNADGAKSGKTAHVVEVHMPTIYNNNYNNGQSSGIEYDYALLTVAEDLSDYVHFSIGDAYDPTNADFVDVPIYVTGVPSTVHEEGNTEKKLVSGFDYAWSGATNMENVLYYTVDTSVGQSGAPVYTSMRCKIGNETLYAYTAIAVHHGGNNTRNSGARLNDQVIPFYGGNNPYVEY